MKKIDVFVIINREYEENIVDRRIWYSLGFISSFGNEKEGIWEGVERDVRLGR